MTKPYRIKLPNRLGAHYVVTGAEPVEISFIGGDRPYIWIGIGNACIATIERGPTVSKLRRFCDQALAKK